jgi:mycoredoxin
VSETKKIIVYGTPWCGDTRRSRKVFEENNIDYEWININNDPHAEAFVKETNHGFRSVPTIIFPDGSILVEPKDEILIEKLIDTGFIFR